MRRIVFLFIIIGSLLSASGKKADKIPAWVKEKVSPAEYKLWKEINDYYVINFERQPLLKCRHLMPEQLKKEEAIMDMLQTTVDKIHELKKDKKAYKSHKQATKEGQGTLDLLFTRQIKPFSVTKDGNVKTVKAIVYSSMDGYDAHLEQTIVYDGNKSSINDSAPGKFFGYDRRL